MTRRRWLGVAALALAVPGAWIDRPTFFAAWLAAWWLWLGVVLGALANAWIHRLTGGRWGDVLRPATLRLARSMPWLLALFLPLLLGLDLLYPWWRAGSASITQRQTRLRKRKAPLIPSSVHWTLSSNGTTNSPGRCSAAASGPAAGAGR